MADKVFDIGVIEYDSCEKCIEFIKKIKDLIARYGSLSVMDYYDIKEIKHDDFAEHLYGWKDLSGIVITYDGTMWRAVLPRPVYINEYSKKKQTKKKKKFEL